MNIEDLKTEWVKYERKLETAQRLNEHIITSMLKERSKSRVAKIRTKNAIYMVLMILDLLFLAAVFVGNPFDFKYNIQFVPFGVLVIGVLLAILSLVKSMQNFSGDLNKINLESFLKKSIGAYEKTRKMERIFGILIIAAVVTPPDIISQILISVPLYFLFEISIVIASRVEKARIKQEEEERLKEETESPL